MARAKSIQAQRKQGFKSKTAELQHKTLRKAHRQGLPWEDDEVARLVAGIQSDETTFDIAISVGRSYYATQSTRRMVAFAMRHAVVLGLSK